MDREKLKRIYEVIFEKSEIRITNFVSNHLERNRVKKLLNKKDKLSREYKKEIKEFWSKYTNIKPYWHKLYSSRSGCYDVRYIPEDLYYSKIDQYFNNMKYGWGVNDKNYYSMWFSDIKQPRTLIRIINGLFYSENYKLINKKQAVDILSDHAKFIIKPSVETGKSKGIVFFEKEKNNKSIEELIDELPGKNYIVQEIIRQHHKLSEVHESSINTVRVMSIILDNKVNIVSAVLRMGVNGSSVDNASAGGIACGIKKDGKLRDVAHTIKGDSYTVHPQGFVFKDAEIPSYNEILDLVKKAHEKLAHFRLVSWDVAVDENGEPILIEANMRKGGATVHQFNNGPLFGELTEKVLEEVFGKK